MRYSEKLHLRYKEEIESWDWKALKDSAMNNCHVDHYEIQYDTPYVIASAFLGSVFALYPSGKYYMPWCTNQTIKDMVRDQAYNDALEEVAESNGMWITCGEGDPCDIFAQLAIDPDDYVNLEDKITFVTSEDHNLYESALRNYLNS